MRYRRLHIRIPASGDVTLTTDEEIIVKSTIINVSAGGLCITAPPHSIDQNEYQIEVITPFHGTIHFSGFPVYQNFENLGIKITSIEKNQLKVIYQIVGSFQLSDDFIKYIDQKGIIHDWLVDESGEDIEITFDTEPEKDT